MIDMRVHAVTVLFTLLSTAVIAASASSRDATIDADAKRHHQAASTSLHLLVANAAANQVRPSFPAISVTVSSSHVFRLLGHSHRCHLATKHCHRLNKRLFKSGLKLAHRFLGL
jgi:hypothetical protein